MTSNERSVEFLSHPLANPLVNAAGLVNGPETRGVMRDVETLSDSAIGAITVGSWTIPRRYGNAVEFGEPMFHYDPATGEMTNSLGLPNVGIEEGEKIVGELIEIADSKEKPVIFSVSPVATSAEIGSSVEQSIELINRVFQAGAKTVELNVSCPNVVTEGGGRKPVMGYDYETMQELVEALNNQPDHRLFAEKLGIKLPPYTTVEQIRELERIAHDLVSAPIGFIAVSNTVAGGKPVNELEEPILTVPGGIGGSSGPATKTEGRLQLAMWRRLAPNLPVVSMLGVYNGEEVAAREAMGATAVGMNTRLWVSRNWKSTISNVLFEYSEHINEE